MGSGLYNFYKFCLCKAQSARIISLEIKIAFLFGFKKPSGNIEELTNAF